MNSAQERITRSFFQADLLELEQYGEIAAVEMVMHIIKLKITNGVYLELPVQHDKLIPKSQQYDDILLDDAHDRWLSIQTEAVVGNIHFDGTRCWISEGANVVLLLVYFQGAVSVDVEG